MPILMQYLPILYSNNIIRADLRIYLNMLMHFITIVSFTTRIINFIQIFLNI